MADEKQPDMQHATVQQVDANPPVRRRGRPPLLPGAPRSDKKPRSVRLNEARWRKLQQLGGAWLERAIDGAVSASASAQAASKHKAH